MSYLQEYIPIITLSTIAGAYMVQQFDEDKLKEKFALKLKEISVIKEMYDKKVKDELKKFVDNVKNKWHEYGVVFESIPEDGLTYEECVNIINIYCKLTNEHINDKQFSGTIYPERSTTNIFSDLITSQNPDEQLLDLYSKIMVNTCLWNSLHDNEFPVANLINYQIGSMVSNLFGGHKDEIMSVVTSGGTQSLMNAVRSYINYGVHYKSIHRSSCVIIAPDTIHAGVMKGADAYNCKLILIKTDKNGKINNNKLKEEIEDNKDNLVALFCSAPSYPYGTKDDYRYFATLAKKYKIGLHVDCCLGGFVMNFIKKYDDSQILAIDGVTSLSADTHKNGLSTKGSSVLICKDIMGYNLMYYSIYTIEDWKGGIYGSPKDEGSQGIVSAFCAYITMLFFGKLKYQTVAENIYNTANKIAEIAKKNDADVLTEDCLNVVAFTFNKLKHGSTHKFADIMKTYGFIFNMLPNDVIHFCVTSRFVSNEEIMVRFSNAFDMAYKETVELNKQNYEFDGSAKLYCSIDTALNPSNKNISWGKYFENYFFGKLTLRDIIRCHFMAQLNPYYKY